MSDRVLLRLVRPFLPNQLARRDLYCCQLGGLSLEAAVFSWLVWTLEAVHSWLVGCCLLDRLCTRPLSLGRKAAVSWQLLGQSLTLEHT
ncbi:hypothetical protein FRX31_029293 [Thalictrum thalictroides]|uniref:Uncharacterized protein n=1 Tax=Thalictrum thalictroides TaxID=46969 RepID=A0A7J6V930_THATH|nr:hypothetical protein FRX31_029293 [Thalictrum thalictroides]